MIILGIDPGTATTGFALLKSEKKAAELIKYGCIRTDSKTPHNLRLKEIFDDVDQLIKNYKPNVCAIEKLFFSKNVKTAMSVAEVRGVIILCATINNLEVYEYTPNEVKLSVAGDGKADKLQVKKMVKLLLKLKNEPSPDDAADAIAIALTHIQKI